MKMTKDVAETLVSIHNLLMAAETKGAASMAVVDSARALEQLVSIPGCIIEESEIEAEPEGEGHEG